MSFVKNSSSSFTFRLSSTRARARARALKVDVKTKKWGALLCASETATQRLRALYVAVPICGHNGAKGAREGMMMVTTPYTAAYTCTLVKEAG